MINFLNTEFIKSASKHSEAPGDNLPEVFLCGKSNVGKSSFINALANNKSLAYTSSKPGHTRLLNYFNVDNKFYLVDAPGYGYAKGGINLDKLFGEMMEDYFSSVNPKLAIILLDSRRELGENDIEIINFVNKHDINTLYIFTKEDKINQKEKSALLKHLKEIGFDFEFDFVSINKKITFEKIKSKINNIIES